ncbi:hypothetical protein TIFTF001_029267 [Ficus carica]|uniref:Uncharacterized protein n=1 Tax=Ficus carica TaxID=3494 RepID=A0AA88DR85_FICCA|nr:hypothetical protein TIFTF001_029267 [Ficus carica]
MPQDLIQSECANTSRKKVNQSRPFGVMGNLKPVIVTKTVATTAVTSSTVTTPAITSSTVATSSATSSAIVAEIDDSGSNCSSDDDLTD